MVKGWRWGIPLWETAISEHRLGCEPQIPAKAGIPVLPRAVLRATARSIRSGVTYFASVDLSVKNENDLRALAWLFGYSAHVATDLAVHPVPASSGEDTRWQLLYLSVCSAEKVSPALRFGERVCATVGPPLDGTAACCAAGRT